MHALLSERARRRASLKRFVRTYRQAAETTTLSEVRARQPREAGDDGATTCRFGMQTRIFGRLSGRVRLPMIEEEDGAGVDWRSTLVFPGLRSGERLQRETTLAARGAILARDGTPLAKGPDRLSDLGPLAAEVAGRVGPAPPEREAELARRGVPEGAPVGLNGLEREFDERLSGTARRRPARRLARRRPRPAARRRGRALGDRPRHPARRGRGARGPLRRHRRAAAGHRRGARALRHRLLGSPAARLDVQDRHAGRRARGQGRQGDGEVPGADGDHARGRRSSRTPTARPAAGRCGSPSPTPATPCSRRWAPSSGPKRLVETAERFGFNQDPGPLGAARSTIPAAEEIGDDLAVGSTAIGQGKVLATPLELATVAATIGLRGRRVAPTLSRGSQGAATRATSERTARVVARFMRTVVKSGHRRRGAGPGRVRGGQDRHRGAAQHGQRGSGAARARRGPDRRSPRRTRPTRTRGSWPSRPTAARAWRSRCCSWARGRAARRPHRRPRRSSRRRSAADGS